METDFLNFHDGEHFSVLGSPDFQDRNSSLLDEYYSHFAFSRHSSDDLTESTNNYWEQDEEQELNGDIAVIPVSGQLDRQIPHLSSSPDCKDDFITDWHHHLATIETPEREDIQPERKSNIEKLTEKPVNNLVNIKKENTADDTTCLTDSSSSAYNNVNSRIKQEIDQVLPNDLDLFSDLNNIKKDRETPTNLIFPPTIADPNEHFIKTETFFTEENITSSANDILLNTSFDKDLKNFDLITAVAKDDIDLDLNLDNDKLDLNQSDLDLNEPFDLTSFINDEIDHDETAVSTIVQEITKNDPLEKKTVLDHNLHIDPPDKIVHSDPIDIKTPPTTPTNIATDIDENDCIDVETVSPVSSTSQQPVLEAASITSLLEQFEANEAVSGSIEDHTYDLPSKPTKSKSYYTPTSVLSLQDIDEKKNKVVDRIKANVKRKPVPVIEPIPNIKPKVEHEKKIMPKKTKSSKSNQSERESFRLDHDYCSSAPAKSQENARDVIDYYKILRRQDINCAQSIATKAIRRAECNTTNTNTSKIIEDTAIRIAEKTPNISQLSQIKHQIVNPKVTPLQKSLSSLLKPENNRMQHSLLNVNQKSLLIKNNSNSLLKSNYKNSDGKLMVSVLKSNVKNMTSPLSKLTVNTVIETKTSKDECIQNIIVSQENEDETEKPKKRKLNLEEYKKRREINKTRSCENSRTNSPVNMINGNSSPLVNHSGSFSLPVTAIGSPASQPSTPQYVENDTKKEKKLSPQELLLKMAADLLTTPAKSATNSANVNKDTKYTIEPFTPPDSTANKSSSPREVEKSTTPTPPKPCNDNIEMKTIVSIGINTDLSLIDEIKTKMQPRNKIQFNIVNQKKETLNRLTKTSDQPLSKQNNSISNELVQKLSLEGDKKLNEIITPILQNVSSKINSNSLISNITETILQKNSKTLNKKTSSASSSSSVTKSPCIDQLPPEHGEDKTVIILDKNRTKPKTRTIEIQTNPVTLDKCSTNSEKLKSTKRNYRTRRESYSSTSSIEISTSKNSRSRKSYQASNSSTSKSLSTSLSSVDSSNWSRSSRSRSRSRSYSRSLSRSSYSSSSSRSRSRSPSSRSYRYSARESRDKYIRSQRRSRSNHNYRNYIRSRSPLRRSNDRKQRPWDNMDQEKLRQVEERRVIYVGRLLPGTTKNDLKRRFSKFGPIVDTSVHFREKGDNYGFVTFQYSVDAFEAIERGNEDPNLPQYDISFGGRRVFCQTRYADLDNSEAIEMSCYNRPIQEDSFDILLKEAQAKLRKRNKV